MVEDIKLMKNGGRILSGKKIIIWGAGNGGKEVLLKLQDGVDVKSIEFIDTDPDKTGKRYLGKFVYPLSRLQEINNSEKDEYVIILSTIEKKAQEEMLSCSNAMEYTVCTRYAIDLVMDTLTFAKKTDKYSELLDRLAWQEKIISNMEVRMQFLEAERSEKAVFVYQSKKVASVTIEASVKSVGIYGVHVHNLMYRGMSLGYIRELVKRKGGKVISLVRDPVARQISLMWHMLGEKGKEYLEMYGSFENMEKFYYKIPNFDDEFEWYQREMEAVLGINVYDYPFDRDAGYALIEQDGISLLLIKVEKLNHLEKIIADFLNEDRFRLCNYNCAEEKKYRYAYANYLKEVNIPTEFLKYYYCNNSYMDHFYTEEEKHELYKKWSG